ncbi:MAG: DNA mismatch repair protein MutT [Chloroflexota bacterium]|nr:MAG: DNA mismatch repair protein MutT [Chloroflexota bacterium]
MIERQAVRALLVSPEEELLLIKIIEPQSQRSFWLTPGGGIDPDESPTASLRREIFEETGLADFEIGPEVWYREHLFNWDGRAILQKERYYLIRVAHFEPTPQHLPDEVERMAFGGFRWWRAADIEQSPEAFAPRGLSKLLQALLQNGPPPQPLALNG